jgi:hypothetical protein
MTNVIETNASKLRALHEAIRATRKRRNDGELEMLAWKEACQRFHNSYDALSFPGGLGNEALLLEKKDPTAIEMAVRFLEADPLFFRSGYIKAELLKHLRRVPVNEDQRKRLQGIILQRIENKKTPREFRWYGRLAAVVTDREFEIRISEIAASSEGVKSTHARWVIAQLASVKR